MWQVEFYSHTNSFTIALCIVMRNIKRFLMWNQSNRSLKSFLCANMDFYSYQVAISITTEPHNEHVRGTLCPEYASQQRTWNAVYSNLKEIRCYCICAAVMKNRCQVLCLKSSILARLKKHNKFRMSDAMHQLPHPVPSGFLL